MRLGKELDSSMDRMICIEKDALEQERSIESEKKRECSWKRYWKRNESERMTSGSGLSPCSSR